MDSEQIKQKALTLGFHKVGIAALADMQDNNQRLQNWLNQGYAADMAWMNNPKRQDIRQLMPEVQSVICVALNYYTPQQYPEGKRNHSQYQ